MTTLYLCVVTIYACNIIMHVTGRYSSKRGVLACLRCDTCAVIVCCACAVTNARRDARVAQQQTTPLSLSSSPLDPKPPLATASIWSPSIHPLVHSIPNPRWRRRSFANHPSIPWSTQTQTPAGNGVHVLIISISLLRSAHAPPLSFRPVSGRPEPRADQRNRDPSRQVLRGPGESLARPRNTDRRSCRRRSGDDGDEAPVRGGRAAVDGLLR